MHKEEVKLNLTEVEKKELEYSIYIETHRLLVRKVWHQISHKISDMFEKALVEQVTERIYYHDLSKYSREEYSPYRRKFYPTSNDLLVPGEIEEDFDKAWRHHYHVNDHHWEYWIDDKGKPMDMYWSAIIEMIIDWQAFGLKCGDTAEEFYLANGDSFNMSDVTRKMLSKILPLFREFNYH